MSQNTSLSAFIPRSVPLALAVVAACACLAATGIRLAVLRHDYDVILTSNYEQSSIYNIWKILHGHPLYEPPDRGTYNLTIFNYLFYHLYAIVASPFSATPAGILLWDRLFTLLLTFGGAAGQFLVIRLLLGGPRDRRENLMAGCFCIVTWLGLLTGWWTLTVRPDILGAAFAIWGLYVALLAVARDRWPLTVLAAVLFFGAWSSKQSAIWILFGLLAYLVFQRRRISHALVLAAVFGALCALALVLGGEDYRRNVLWAPSLNPITLDQFAPNCLIFLIANPIALLAWLAFYEKGAAARLTWAPPALLFGFFTFLGCAVTSARAGSSQNHYFEAAIIFSTLSAVCLCERPQGGSRLFQGTVVLLWAGSLAVAVAQVVFPAGIPGASSWHTLRITAARAEHRRDFSREMAALPKPIFSDDGLLAEPWLATNDGFPAFLMDGTVYPEMLRQGKIRDGGVNALVQSGYFGSLVLQVGDDLIDQATRRGYVKRGSPRLLPLAFRSWQEDDFVVLVRGNAGTFSTRGD